VYFILTGTSLYGILFDAIISIISEACHIPSIVITILSRIFVFITLNQLCVSDNFILLKKNVKTIQSLKIIFLKKGIFVGLSFSINLDQSNISTS
jgi:hypothetical protein